MRNIRVFMICFVLLLPCWAVSQELIHDEAIKVAYDSVYCNWPVVIYNGAGHGVFYYWSGAGDKDQGLHFRRLDADAQPVGPQKMLLALEQGTGYPDGAWDGEAYVVSYRTRRSSKIYLLRVSPTGRVLAQQTISREGNIQLFVQRIFVIGEEVFLFFEEEQKKGLYLYDSYMAHFDRKLGGSVVIKKLPTGGFKNSFFCGVTHDADKFLIMLGEWNTGYWSYYKVKNISLLQVNFTGKVIKKPYAVPIIQEAINRIPSPADGVLDSLLDSWYVYGPVFVGDGYIVLVSRSPDPYPDGSDLMYDNQTYKIDEDGNLLFGPFNLGSGYYYFESGRLVGNHVGFLALNFTTLGPSYIALIGKMGAPIGNSYYGDTHNSADWEFWGTHAYTGMANTIVYQLYKGWWLGLGSSGRIYANQYRMPAFSKPGFFYFKAGTAEPVKNHRLVMWSVVLGKNVTLKGPDFEVKDLPPVWSYLVDTKGQKTKLTLSFTTEDGQTKKKRLVINP